MVDRARDVVDSSSARYDGGTLNFYVNRESAARETTANDEAGKQVKLADLAIVTSADKTTQEWLELELDYARQWTKFLEATAMKQPGTVVDKMDPGILNSCYKSVKHSLRDGVLFVPEPDQAACK